MAVPLQQILNRFRRETQRDGPETVLGKREGGSRAPRRGSRPNVEWSSFKATPIDLESATTLEVKAEPEHVLGLDVAELAPAAGLDSAEHERDSPPECQGLDSFALGAPGGAPVPHVAALRRQGLRSATHEGGGGPELQRLVGRVIVAELDESGAERHAGEQEEAQPKPAAPFRSRGRIVNGPGPQTASPSSGAYRRGERQGRGR